MMKKTRRILLTLLLPLVLAACATPSTTVIPSPSSTVAPIPAFATVTFADPVLESLVRATLGQPEGGITLTQAHAVTTMNLNQELQSYLSEVTPITDLGGLENFTNLESLDLSQNAVSDISPLAGLTKLTSLSLAGNPVADVSPLTRLTNLKVLILSDSQAQGYSALSNLVNLQVLLLDNSTISDVSPLVSLTNLQTLYLDNSSVEDFSPLEDIYTTLAKKDFTISSTLKDFGFILDPNGHEAQFDTQDASFTIHHESWGPPSREDNLNIIRMSMYLKDAYKVSIGYYDIHKCYVVQIDKEGEPQVNYLFYPADGSPTLPPEDQTHAEQMIRAAMDLQEGEDVLAAPVSFFNEAVKKNFKIIPEKLFSMPFEPPTLKSLGFFADQPNAVYRYVYQGERDVNMEIHRPEWGEKDFDVSFFTPISDEYRVFVNYDIADKKFQVKADDNDLGGAVFFYFPVTGEHIDDWCSDPNKTVEEYFIKAYNNPAIEDVYQHSADLMVQFIRDTFSMTIEELYSLPTGE